MTKPTWNEIGVMMCGLINEEVADESVRRRLNTAVMDMANGLDHAEAMSSKVKAEIKTQTTKLSDLEQQLSGFLFNQRKDVKTFDDKQKSMTYEVDQIDCWAHESLYALKQNDFAGAERHIREVIDLVGPALDKIQKNHEPRS